MKRGPDPAELLGQLVCLERGRFTQRRVAEGFLVATSEAWLVLHRVDGRLDLDGYAAFRTRDLTGVSANAPRLDVVRRALSLKGRVLANPGAIDLGSTRGLLESVQTRHGVLVAYRERRDPHEGEIGRMRLAAEQTFTMDRLTPDAAWEPDDRVFRYEDVTCVRFAGEYETTLHRLAG